MKKAIQHIPDTLIYEMVEGQPIYYKGYQEYLKGNKHIDELMGSSYLQAYIITTLVISLSRLLDTNQYRIIASELGLQFSKKSWRAADLAIYDKKKLKGIPLTNKYLDIPPEIVIEVDTKANLMEIENPLNYYQEKTDELLNFGVKKVIWIFTDTQKIMLANNKDDWHIFNWKQDMEVMEGVKINIQDLVADAEL